MTRLSRISRRTSCLLLVLLLAGCDAIANRLFNDPLRVVRVTTHAGHSVVLMQPYVDYLHAIGAGRYDRAAYSEGNGLRTTDGLLNWSDFSALTIRPRETKPVKAIGDEAVQHEAEVDLKGGGRATKTLRDTPFRGLVGWQKTAELPVASGQVWTEIPLQAVARIELLEPLRERALSREFLEVRVKARKTDGDTCEGSARVYRPLPVQSNVDVSHDDAALGFWVEDRGILIELDLADIRELTVADGKDGQRLGTFTLNDGVKRTYPMRNAYFELQTNVAGCRRVRLADLASAQIERRP